MNLQSQYSQKQRYCLLPEILNLMTMFGWGTIQWKQLKREYPTAIYCIKNEPVKLSSHFNVSVKWTNHHLFAICLRVLEITGNHKHPFVTEKHPPVIKTSSKGASKSWSNSNSSLCPKWSCKGKRLVRQSKPPTEPSIAMNDNDVSDEVVAPVHPKWNTKKSASGDGDVPLVKKPQKSKVMNKKEHYRLRLQFLLMHHISRSCVADKFKAEKNPIWKIKAVCWERISY